MRENGNEKKDEKGAAHCDCVCLNDFHGGEKSERLESMMLKGDKMLAVKVVLYGRSRNVW